MQNRELSQAMFGQIWAHWGIWVKVRNSSPGISFTLGTLWESILSETCGKRKNKEGFFAFMMQLRARTKPLLLFLLICHALDFNSGPLALWKTWQPFPVENNWKLGSMRDKILCSLWIQILYLVSVTNISYSTAIRWATLLTLWSLI